MIFVPELVLITTSSLPFTERCRPSPILTLVIAHVFIYLKSVLSYVIRFVHPLLISHISECLQVKLHWATKIVSSSSSTVKFRLLVFIVYKWLPRSQAAQICSISHVVSSSISRVGDPSFHNAYRVETFSSSFVLRIVGLLWEEFLCSKFLMQSSRRIATITPSVTLFCLINLLYCRAWSSWTSSANEMLERSFVFSRLVIEVAYFSGTLTSIL